MTRRVIREYNLNNLWPLDTAGSSGTSFSQPKGIVDGCFSLTASLVVTGSDTIGDLATASGGIGINGNTLNGSSSTESLRFSILILCGAGVSVVLNWLADLGLSYFGGNDLAVLSRDNDYFTTGDNFTVDSAGTSASTPVPGTLSAFTVFSVLDTQKLLMSSVTASFTATAAAVPEPSPFGTLVIVAFDAPLLRRFRRRANSVDSEVLVA